MFGSGPSRCGVAGALLAAAVFVGAAGPLGCANKGAPEQVADAFADAYFREVNQEKAKEYTALSASVMLDAELKDVAEIRNEGYPLEDARIDVILRRGDPLQRDARVRFPYEIVIKADGVERIQDADIELAQIQGAWKVVRVGLRPR